MTVAPAGLLALLASPGLAAEASAWRVVRAELRVECPLTLGGSFEARSAALVGSVSLAPPAAAFGGDLSVDLRTLDTGIALRNDHMRERYLEVGRGEGFERAVLGEIRLDAGSAETFEGRTGFSGTLGLHGARNPIAGRAEIRRQGASIRVEASFPVTLADYGIAKPQYLGVGVKGEVHVKVTLVATPVPEGESP